MPAVFRTADGQAQVKRALVVIPPPGALAPPLGAPPRALLPLGRGCGGGGVRSVVPGLQGWHFAWTGSPEQGVRGSRAPGGTTTRGDAEKGHRKKRRPDDWGQATNWCSRVVSPGVLPVSRGEGCPK